MPLKLQHVPAQAQAAAGAGLLVFVHGLNGHSQTSWGLRGQAPAFIQRLSDAHPQFSVATLDYPCNLADYAQQPSLTVDIVAGQWAELLRPLLADRSRRIGFITHCLGGLVTLLALRRLALERGCHATVDITAQRVLCLLMDAPLRLPKQALPARLDTLVHRLRLDVIELEANCAHYNDTHGHRPLIRTVHARQANWLTPFEPAAIGDQRDHRAIDTAHEDMSRAPSSGDHPPLACAIEAVNDWSLLGAAAPVADRREVAC